MSSGYLFILVTFLNQTASSNNTLITNIYLYFCSEYTRLLLMIRIIHKPTIYLI